MTEEVLLEVAKAIQLAAYDNDKVVADRNWNHNDMVQDKRKREAAAAISAYRSWLAKNP